ncbi:hypothetical protein IM697_44045 [Streptomyces ferrugineus]|uniref:Uncharacterized protein n=1 Tax=Streptomyces ferrugineus TaxID=1413221 RepID=A0A7M2SZL6_9ACTN|nr:hypothetical protein [Streptomyces ferrugineus]QOV41594.1 hypothetical protein IM697_44045 [Streptomyces ferrugineus]
MAAIIPPSSVQRPADLELGWAMAAEAAPIYQHSDDDRQQEVAAGLDATVRRARQEGAAVPERHTTADHDGQQKGPRL